MNDNKIDVLAVMDRAFTRLNCDPSESYMAAEVRESRSVIAKLIEAVNELPRNHASVCANDIKRIRAALDRIAANT